MEVANVPNIIQDVSAFPHVTFPNLDDECQSLLEDIISHSIPGSEELSYSSEIQKKGGITIVKADLVSLILPEIRQVEGRRISPEVIDDIQRTQRQANILESPTGYAGVVTDARNQHYIRNYVGQCKLPQRRILRQHALSILRGSYSSLFYYLLWLGNGHRTVNFIRLWAFPPTVILDSYYQLRANILEALFCRAFGTTYGGLLGQTAGHIRGVGLNIMTPLIQSGGGGIEGYQLQAIAGLSKSPDPQIRAWVAFRSAQKEKSQVDRHANRPSFRMDFRDSLFKACGDSDLFNDVMTSLQSWQNNVSQPGGQNHEDTNIAKIPFYGNLSAKVAIVLDYASHNPAAAHVTSDPEVILENGDLPWALTGCGFTQQNVLVWTRDFRKFSTLNAASFVAMSMEEELFIRDSHTTLLKICQSRIFLLCSPRANRTIRKLLKDPITISLEIRGFKYTAYIDKYLYTDRRRLFIHCPEIPSRSWVLDSIQCAKISELLRFTSTLIRLEGVRSYFIESSSIVSTIFKRVHLERNGYKAMTLDTLDPGIKLWLNRKGISNKEDILAIKDAAGSLSWGLLMVLHALQRCGLPQSHLQRGVRNHANVPFDRTALEKVKLLVRRLVNERNERYAAKLSQLPRLSTTSLEEPKEGNQSSTYGVTKRQQREDDTEDNNPRPLKRRDNNQQTESTELECKSESSTRKSIQEEPEKGEDYEATAEDIEVLVNAVQEMDPIDQDKEFSELPPGEISNEETCFKVRLLYH